MVCVHLYLFASLLLRAAHAADSQEAHAGRSILTRYNAEKSTEQLLSTGIGPYDFPRNLFKDKKFSVSSGGIRSWRDSVPAGAVYPYNLPGYNAAELFFVSVALLCVDVTDWDATKCGVPCSTINLTDNQRYRQDQTGAAVIVGRLAEELVVSFRGTSGVVDARRNIFFSAVARQCDECLVHGGFYSHWSFLKRFTLLRVNYLKAKYAYLRVVLASLSLGAACNSLAILGLINNHVDVDMVMSFGSPRVGNPQWMQTVLTAVGNRTYSMVKARDLVPHVPPLFAGFKSFNSFSFGEDYDVYRVCEENSSEEPCPASYRIFNMYDHITYFQVDLLVTAYLCGGGGDAGVQVAEDYDLLLLDLTDPELSNF